MRAWVVGLGLLLAVLLPVAGYPFAAAARPLAPEAVPPDPEIEIQAAMDAAARAKRPGPVQIDLLDQAVLDLPAGYAFIPTAQAAHLMRLLGNPADDVLGVIVGEDGLDGWIVIVEFVKAGYIRDDEARDWNADRLLDGVRDATEQENAERRARGITEIDVVGWIEPPIYDATNRRVVSSIIGRDRGVGPDAEEHANYSICALGREGYVTIILLSEPALLGEEKMHARRLVTAFAYRDGKKHTDFDAGTDRVSGHGLGAVVTGAAAR